MSTRNRQSGRAFGSGVLWIMLLLTSVGAHGQMAPESSGEIELYSGQFYLARLTPDQPYTDRYFSIDSAAHVQIDVQTQFDTFAVSLYDPNGTMYDGSNIATLNGEYYTIMGPEQPGGLFIIPVEAPGAHYQFVFQPIVSGDYAVTISAPGITEEAPVLITVITDSPVRANLFATEPIVVVRYPVVLSAAIAENANPLRGATVAAYVKPPNSAEFTLPLNDYGNDADAQWGDGLYSGYFIPTEVGEYTAVAHMTGTTAEGFGFARMGSTSVQVIQACATLTGNVNSFGADDNGNGLYDRLVVSAELNVTTPATFVLRVYLETPLGKKFTAQGEANLAAGVQ